MAPKYHCTPSFVQSPMMAILKSKQLYLAGRGQVPFVTILNFSHYTQEDIWSEFIIRDFAARATQFNLMFMTHKMLQIVIEVSIAV
jgi:hypothetical protein